MPNSEKVISPGVFTTEIDQSFLPAAVGEIGGCLIGPTVKGPAMSPIIVNSYSEFQQRFGDTFKSGSSYYQYLTSYTAREYLKNGGSLTVIRIAGGGFTDATSSINSSGVAGTAATVGSASLFINNQEIVNSQISIGGVDFTFVAAANQAAVDLNYNHSSTEMYVASGSGANSASANLVKLINDSSSIHGLTITASEHRDAADPAGWVANALGRTVQIYSGSYTLASASADLAGLAYQWSGSSVAAGTTIAGATQSSAVYMAGETAGQTSNSFTLHTHGDGVILNNFDAHLTGSNNALLTGSKDNLRWEIASINNSKGTFNLLIRRGDDTHKRKKTLETWNNLSLDPNSENYIAKRVGNQDNLLAQDGDGNVYLQQSGSYVNKSKYVWADVHLKTIDYLDENGDLRYADISGSLPQTGSGSNHGAFGGGSDGTQASHPHSFYENITGDNFQGLSLADSTTVSNYTDALSLVGNQDEYDINLIMTPGIQYGGGANHRTIITKALTVAEDRGDCFYLFDGPNYGGAVSDATTVGNAYDNNYGATYYPWIQIPDNLTGENVWVPPSVVMPGVYAFNDKVAHEWFAPAGLNRGGIDVAIQAERKLTHSMRDDLYEANVNPIATFPGQGVVAWGQKTLQKKASALDRINVRRLLIRLKKFIASSSRFLVFEQNNGQTRRRFLSIVNPYLEQVQANSGLTAFKVVMDETNNTPDVVDRNILYGQLFIQPTRTAEFVVLDFTVQPTGATFPE